MSATTVRLLEAASEILGGSSALAQALGVGEMLLARFMDDSRELPDALLLRAVDIIIADRQARLPLRPARTGLLSPGPEILQNSGRGDGPSTDGAAG